MQSQIVTWNREGRERKPPWPTLIHTGINLCHYFLHAKRRRILKSHSSKSTAKQTTDTIRNKKYGVSPTNLVPHFFPWCMLNSPRNCVCVQLLVLTAADIYGELLKPNFNTYIISWRIYWVPPWNQAEHYVGQIYPTPLNQIGQKIKHTELLSRRRRWGYNIKMDLQ
jgi:hypothetical protein